MDHLYTEEEAAAILKIEPRALARLRRSGRIGVIQVTPRRYLYTDAHLQDYLSAHLQPPSQSQHHDVGLTQRTTGAQLAAALGSPKAIVQRSRNRAEPSDGASYVMPVVLPDFGESSSRKPSPRKRR